MKKELYKNLAILIFAAALVFSSFGAAYAQTSETFDIVSFKTPKGWVKKPAESAVQFTKEDAAKGTYGAITLYKSVPGTPNAKENFDLVWNSLVKEMVTVADKPEMQPAATKDGWETQSGYAAFESDGNKGVVVLVTASGFDKMVNLIILTNTDAYEKEISSFIESISLKKLAPANKETTITQTKSTNLTKSANPVEVAINDGFKFTTSNFDDGWTSAVQNNWVQVTKGDIKVLLHYALDESKFHSDPEPATNMAWNILVAPRYSDLKNYKTTYTEDYLNGRAKLGMGNATDKATGKNVYIVLYSRGMSGWAEVISPDKNSFIRQFNFDPETIQYNSKMDLLNSVAKMADYNKFAVAESDFTGTWTSDSSSMEQGYGVITGNYVVRNLSQANREFVFGKGNSYNWNFVWVTDNKVVNVNSVGKFSVPNNWQIHFSKIESGPKTYHAFWSCIKGARLLHLLNANSPGSGIYEVYGKKK